MRIEIPMLPGRELNPNWHGHWSRKAKATRVLREAVYYCCVDAGSKKCNPIEKAEVSITFVIRDARGYKDADNALASLKPAIDGCVDARVITGDDDAHLRYRLPIMYEVDKERTPLTILEFREGQW